MERNPIRKSGFLGFMGGSMPRFFDLKRGTLAALLVVFMVAGAGTAYASQQSLPGEVLYSVKLNVVEPLEVVFAFTPEAKAIVELQHSENRLQEADVLANELEINPALYTQLEAQFQKKAAKVQERIKKLEELDKTEKALELTARYEASLATHQEILSKLIINVGVNVEQVAAIEQRVAAQQKSNAEVSSNVEIKIAQQGENNEVQKRLAEVRIDIARRAITNTQSFLEKVSSKKDAGTVTAATEKIVAAKSELESAKTAYD
jgi:hypothetical protein